MRFFIGICLALVLSACGGSGGAQGPVTGSGGTSGTQLLTVSSSTVTEGGRLSFTVNRSGSTELPAGFSWTTSSGSATSGSDFTAASGQGVIPPGQSSVTLYVQTTSDTSSESDETFSVVATPQLNAGTVAARGTGTIYNASYFLDFTSATLPTEATLTRASTGTYVNSTGSVASAAVNGARLDYDLESLAVRGTLVESAATNSLRNSTIVGGANGVIGAGGTNPTNWSALPVTGIDVERVGTGTENGLNYIDLRFYGNNVSGTQFTGTYFDSSTGITATTGQTWTLSFNAKITAGSIPSGVDVRMAQYERTNVGGALTLNEQDISLTTNRAWFSYTRTLSNASTARVQPGMRIRVPNATVMDVTIRIYSPQIELGSFATSRIPTTGAAAVARSADQLSVAVADGTYNVRIATPFVSYDQTNVVVAGGTGWTFAWPAAAVTAGQTQLKHLIFSTTTLPPDNNLLEWSPPTQTAPTTVSVTSATYYGPYADTQDIILVMPNSIRLTQVQVDGGRHIRVIGGYLQPLTKPSGDFSLRLSNITGSAFIEGMIIDASNITADGVVVIGKTGYTPDVYLQNMRVVNINGTNAGIHADVFQNQGPIGNLYVDRLTGNSNYQGFFIPPQFAISSANFRRTNLNFSFNASHTTTFLLWLRDTCTQTAYPSTFSEVYLDPRSGQDISVGGLWPNSSQTGCAAAKLYTSAYWPAGSSTTGSVFEGAPTEGDFAPAANIGAFYRSPGYK